jgi:hypothetical protein
MVDYYDDGRRRRRRSPIQSIDNIDQFRWREVCVLWMPPVCLWFGLGAAGIAGCRWRQMRRWFRPRRHH